MNYISLRLTGLKCTNPVRIRNPDLFYKDGSTKRLAHEGEPEAYFVGCGKCYVCLQARRQQWSFRLNAQQRVSQQSVFLTLTMDDDNVHDVCKRDLQLFFKRLRKMGYKFKYYAIGEYGTHTHRPHYHAIMFFNSYVPFSELENSMNKLWDLGFIYFGNVTSKSITYVLHYHVRPKQVDGKSTFAVYSKGLGLDFIDNEVLTYFQNSKDYFIHVDGSRQMLPRYYRKKFDLPVKDFQIEIPDIHDDSFQYLLDLRDINKRKFQMYNEQDKF